MGVSLAAVPVVELVQDPDCRRHAIGQGVTGTDSNPGEGFEFGVRGVDPEGYGHRGFRSHGPAEPQAEPGAGRARGDTVLKQDEVAFGGGDRDLGGAVALLGKRVGGGEQEHRNEQDGGDGRFHGAPQKGCSPPRLTSGRRIRYIDVYTQYAGQECF